MGGGQQVEKKFGSHFFLKLAAQDSGISVYFGQAYLDYWFVCIPNFEVGLLIGHLDNVDYNAEKIGAVLGHWKDGVTVAYALQKYAQINKIQSIDPTKKMLDLLSEAGFVELKEDHD